MTGAAGVTLQHAVASLEGPVLALSPHLDDAVLSCGGLLRVAGRGVPVVVASVFTDSGPPPYPLMARRICAATGEPDPARLQANRKAEDTEVLAALGAQLVHLGLPEAPFRRSGRRLGPSATYPTFRFDALRGRVSRWDAAVCDEVAATLADLLERHRPGLVLAPLGIGGHVDHVIVRDAVAAIADSSDKSCHTWYYSDFPYLLRAKADPRFVAANRLTASSWMQEREAAVELIRGYRSQVPVLFPGSRIPRTPEQYWRSAPTGELSR